MKDLKHYFNSPTESDQKSTKSSSNIQSEQEKKEKSAGIKEPALKKRKVSLKNDKVKAVPVSSKAEKTTENQLESSLDDVFEPTSNKKKRKCNNDKKPKLKKSKDLKIHVEDHSEKDTKKDTKNSNADYAMDKSSNNQHDNFLSENSNSSDKNIVKSKIMKKKLRILEESDEEVTVVEDKLPPEPEDKTENNTNDEKNSVRNSLFSYFNKVDKGTVLKQQSVKIKVEAVVHVPEPGTKVARKSLEKFTPVSKQTKRKNKLLLENSDTIEVISSEEINENSSNGANILMAPKPLVNIDTETTKSPQDIVDGPETKVRTLASIFVQKKKENPCPSVDSAQFICESSLPVEKKTVDKSEKKSSLKLKKKTKEKNSPSLQCKELPAKKESFNDGKETKASTADKQAAKNDNNDVVDSSKLQKSSTPNRNNLSNTNNSNPETPKESKNESVNKTLESTRERSKEQKLSTSKCKTLNGYFTPKRLQKDREDLEESSGKKSTPGWVMKVRFGASKSLQYSDEDSQDSTKEKFATAESNNDEQAEEIKENTPDVQCENESSNDVVIVYDTEDILTEAPCKEKEPIAANVFEISKKKRPRRSCLDKNPAGSSSPSNSPCKKKEKVAVKKWESSNEKRPRRSCTERKTAVMDLDDEDSSEVKENTSKRKLVSKNTKKSILSPVANKIDVAESPKPQVKMWLFFNKATPKQKEAPVDEAKMKAKQLFLESGIPEVVKRKVDSAKCEVVLGSPAPFPSVSHVSQAVVEPPACLRLPTLRPDSPPPCLPAWSQVTCTARTEEAEILVFQRPKNVKTFLNQLKEEEPKTDVKVMFKRLKEYKSKAESDIWTEIYKPTQSADMVGNSESLKKLKSWLEALKNRRKREGSESSGDEFLTEEDSNEDNSYNNMAVISGPCGCGKTSAVYAVANELDCKVLEINASCNRAGKKILAEFSESTQSHQVERSQSNGLFSNQHSGKSKKRKKSKANEPKSEKTSLILVEDADLLFTDVDEGFMSSLSSLAATTKRPIILVTNQTHNPHLERFQNSRLLQLTFNRPKPNKLALWLRLVGLVEGVEMSPTEADRLVTWAKCDVRKCLLQLQLMVHSNNSEIKEVMSDGDLWWHWPSKHRLSFELPSLHEPEETAEQTSQDKQWIARQLQSVAQTTSQLAYLDLLSSNSSQRDCRDNEPCPVAWRTVCKDSTALTECRGQHGNDDTTHELSTWFSQAVAVEGSLRNGLTSSEARWQSILRQGEQYYTAGVSSSYHTSHCAVTCDYLPTLRELGRAEKLRLANYSRRANRFFHYLQGLNIHASQSFRDFMSEVFS